MHLLIWILAALSLGLWSLACWATYALLSIDPAWVGDLKPLLDQLPGAGWVDVWLPGWQDLVAVALDLTQALLKTVGGFVAGVGLWLVWVVWAVVALFIVAGAGLASGVVALARRALKTPQPPASPPPLQRVA